MGDCRVVLGGLLLMPTGSLGATGASCMAVVTQLHAPSSSLLTFPSQKPVQGVQTLRKGLLNYIKLNFETHKLKFLVFLFLFFLRF